VLSDSPEPDSARSARPVAKAAISGPTPADRNRVDADGPPHVNAPPGKLPSKEQNLGVVHGRRRPNKD
jgi:hypothetical protein